MINLRKDDGVADVIILIKTQAAHQLPHGLTDAAGYEYAEHDLKVKSFIVVFVVETNAGYVNVKIILYHVSTVYQIWCNCSVTDIINLDKETDLPLFHHYEGNIHVIITPLPSPHLI